MKIKRGGAYVNASPFVKRGGVYSAANASVKKGATYLPAGEAPQPISDLSNVNTIVIFGASINDGILVGNTGTTASVAGWQDWILEYYGKTVTVVDKSTPGDRMTQFLARIDADLAPYAGNANVAFCVDLLGGDITNNAKWADLSPSLRQQYYDGVQTIYQKVVANGNALVPITATFRDYLRGGVYAKDDESIGSLPWIENILYPLAQQYAPDFWFNGRPLLEQYNITFNNWTAWSNPSDSARVHYTDNGYRALGSWMFERLCNRLYLSQVDANVAKLAAPKALDEYGQDEIIVSIGATATGTSTTKLGYNYGAFGGYTNAAVLCRRGYNAYQFNQAALTQGTAQTFTYADNSVSLTRTAAVNTYVRVGTGAGVTQTVQTITVPKAGVPYRIGVTVARQSATAYNCSVSVDGGATWADVVANYASASTVPTPIFLDVTPSTTSVPIQVRAGEEGYGYANVISIKRLS